MSPGPELPRIGREPELDRVLSRRAFLALVSSGIAATVLATCANGDDNDTTPTAVAETVVTGSPVATEPSEASPETNGSPQPDRSVAMFLTLSSALTGFDDLSDQQLAETYLGNLGEEGSALVDLFSAVGLSSPDVSLTFDQVESAGVFDDDRLSALADKITVYWYSGKYQQPDGQDAVATFINALAWPATGYRVTGPSSCTGQTGVWTSPPA
ncbi:MAG: sorbitol dehydrogenase family protein [Thermomicrobiales bacterium]|nr:sorbitol dehydrogenase family protein [Thermomicrobiales bacterium]